MQLKGAGNMREKRVNLKIPAYVRETLTALETAGHQAYCVGGCVRDSLLGRMPEDWDVTTSALPEETMKVFGATGFVGLRFPVCVRNRYARCCPGLIFET